MEQDDELAVDRSRLAPRHGPLVAIACDVIACDVIGLVDARGVRRRHRASVGASPGGRRK
jgi:hypothetical protein